MGRPSALTGNARRHAISLVRKHGGVMASNILNAASGTALAAHRAKTVDRVNVSSVTLISYARLAGANIRTQRGRRPAELVTV